MDCRLTTREGEPASEWTWDGNDEMDPAQGRRLGIFKPHEEKAKKAREKERGERFCIEVLGRPLTDNDSAGSNCTGPGRPRFAA
jgi:hypothetical protein